MNHQTAANIAAELQSGATDLTAYINDTLAQIRADEHNAFLLTAEPFSGSYQPLSPLSGVAVALADNILVKDELGTAGSLMLHNFIPPYGATVADKLDAAGLVRVGKTNLAEFGLGCAGHDAAFGPVLHPRSQQHISEGAAAAVALGLVPLAVAVDSCGQVRKQAALAGIACLKPTYGTISRFGIVPYIESTETAAICAHNLRDAALLFQILAGHDEKDGTTYPTAAYTLNLEKRDIDGLKIALPREYFTAEVAPEIREAIGAFCRRLEALGATVTEVDLPLAPYAHLALQAMAAAEGANNLSRYDGLKYGYQSEQNRTLDEIYCNSRSEAFLVDAKRTAILGAHLLAQGQYADYYHKALQIRRLVQEQVQALFQDYDLILTPAARGTAYALKENAAYFQDNWQDSMYTAIPSLTGIPAAVLPLGESADGLPFGLQLIANTLQEEKLVQLALAVEA